MKFIYLIIALLISTFVHGKERNNKVQNPLPYSFKTYFQLFGTNEFYIKSQSSVSQNIFDNISNPSFFSFAFAATLPAKKPYSFHQIELNSINLRPYRINIDNTGRQFKSKTFSIAILYSYNINIRKGKDRIKPFQIYLGINSGLGYLFYVQEENLSTAYPTAVNIPSLILGIEPKFIFQTKSPIYIECSLPLNVDFGWSIRNTRNPNLPMRNRKSSSFSLYNLMPITNLRVAFGINISKKSRK